MKTSVGLEIRSDQIRLVSLAKLTDGLRVESCLTLTLPQASAESSMRQVRTWLAERLPKKREATLSVSGSSAFVRAITVLPIKEKTLEQAIGYEAEQQIPFSLQEVEWDWCSLVSSVEAKPKSQTRALLVAVKKEIIDQGLQQAQSFGVQTAVMDLAPLALYNSAKLSGRLRHQTPSVILNVEKDSTDLLIMRASVNSEMIPEFWVRSLPFGLNESNQTLKDLVAEIKRSVEFRLGEDAQQLGQVLLSGEGAASNELIGDLRESMDVLIESMDPFQSTAKIGGDTAIPEGNERSVYGVAMGLALRGIGPVPLEVNLARRWVTVRQEGSRKQKYSVLVFIVSLILIVSSLLGNWTKLESEKLNISRLHEKLSNYEKYSPKIIERKEKVSVREKQVLWLKEIVEKRNIVLSVLNSVGMSMPNEAWLEDTLLEIPSEQGQWGKLDIKGFAKEYNDVNSFVGTLRSAAVFSEVKPLSSTLVKPLDGNGDEVVEFAISAVIEEK